MAQVMAAAACMEAAALVSSCPPVGAVLPLKTHCMSSVLVVAAAHMVGGGCGEQRVESCILHSRWCAPLSCWGACRRSAEQDSLPDMKGGAALCCAFPVGLPNLQERGTPGKQPPITPCMLVNAL